MGKKIRKDGDIYSIIREEHFRNPSKLKGDFGVNSSVYEAIFDFYKIMIVEKRVREKIDDDQGVSIKSTEIFKVEPADDNYAVNQFLENIFVNNDNPDEGIVGKTRHEYIQKLFDDQREKTAEVHGSLEKLLNKKDLTNLDTQTKLDGISGMISYNINMFYELDKDVKLFQEGMRKTIPNETFTQSFVFFDMILEMKSASADLMRALTLRYIIDSLKESQAMYQGMADDTGRVAFANKFLKNISLPEIIEKTVNSNNRWLLPRLIEKELKSFEAVYEWYKPTIEKAVGISREKKDFEKRYELAQGLQNKELLLGAAGNEREFNNRKRFSARYGEVENPFEAYKFIDTFIYSSRRNATKKALEKYLNNYRLPHFVKMGSEGTLAHFIQLDSDDKKNMVIESMERKDVDLTVEVLDIVANTKSYESLYQSMHDRVRAQIKSPSQLITDKDFDAMKTYFNDLAAIESRVEKITRYDHLKTNKFRILDRLIYRIAETDPKFLTQERDAMIEARDLFIENGHPVGYGAVLHQMTRVPTTIERCNILYTSLHEYRQELETRK